MRKGYFYLIITIAILAVAGGLAYFFLYINKPASSGTASNGSGQSGFSPFGNTGGGNNGAQGSNPANGATGTSSAQSFSYPKVREVWPTPVGGYVASSTASSTFVRFVDRGTGYVYDMAMDSPAPANISNTTVPLIYQSFWQGNAMAAVFRYIKEGTDDITNFYVQLRPTAMPSAILPSATSTASTTGSVLSQTEYELRGAYFPGTVLAMAVSPSGKQLFTIEDVNGNGNGYISNFDGSGSTEVFSTPLEQVNAFWPTAGTLMMATKASSATAGYLYSIDAKTGTMTEVLGGLVGLSVLPNPTGNLILYSDISNSGSLVTSLYNVKNASSQDLPFVTLPEKCAWSRLNPTDLFCAVPTAAPAAGYPDSWYQGTASGIDSIWEIDTDTGNVHQVSNLVQDAKAQIDAEDLSLDPSERYLYFINKKDLSLWSIDLNQVN